MLLQSQSLEGGGESGWGVVGANIFHTCAEQSFFLYGSNDVAQFSLSGHVIDWKWMIYITVMSLFRLNINYL